MPCAVEKIVKAACTLKVLKRFHLRSLPPPTWVTAVYGVNVRLTELLKASSVVGNQYKLGSNSVNNMGIGPLWDDLKELVPISL